MARVQVTPAPITAPSREVVRSPSLGSSPPGAMSPSPVQAMTVFEERATIYSLQNNSWVKLGVGDLSLLFNFYNPNELVVRLVDPESGDVLQIFQIKPKLKSKGPTSWVLKGRNTRYNNEEVLAIRFLTERATKEFKVQLSQRRRGVRPVTTTSEDLFREMPQIAWSCDLCTFTNDPGDKRCLVCSTPRPVVIEIAPSDASEMTADMGENVPLSPRGSLVEEKDTGGEVQGELGERISERFDRAAIDPSIAAPAGRNDALARQSSHIEGVRGSYLPMEPLSPTDISSTEQDFREVGERIANATNGVNTKLFSTLKRVSLNLYSNDPRYRQLDVNNKTLIQRLLRFEHVNEWLMLLGFSRADSNGKMTCPQDQPPQSVIRASVDVCEEYASIRRIVSDIKRFSKTAKDVTHMSAIHSLRSELKNRPPAVAPQRPPPMVDEASLGRKPTAPVTCKCRQQMHVHRVREIRFDHMYCSDCSRQINDDENLFGCLEDHSLDHSGVKYYRCTTCPGRRGNNNCVCGEPLKTLKSGDLIDRVETCSYCGDLLPDTAWFYYCAYERVLHPGNGTYSLCTKCAAQDWDEKEPPTPTPQEENITEDDADLLTLQDITWFITHESYRNTEARDVLLLCHKAFVTSFDLLEVMQKRFHCTVKNDDDEIDQEKTWNIQVKVAIMLRNWMKNYWKEDFETQDELLDLAFVLIAEMEDAAQSNMKIAALVEALNQTVENEQKAVKTQMRSQARTTSRRNKIAELMGVPSQFNIVDQDEQTIAEQITLMDFRIFRKIQKRECVGQAWKKRNRVELAPNILDMIDQFNRVAKWVQVLILTAPNLRERVRVVKKCIKIAMRLKILQNFSSLCAFHSALSSTPIYRLKHAWKGVQAKYLQSFEDIKLIFSSEHGFRKLRDLHGQAVAPAIPYIGIFLQDLVAIEEGNADRREGKINFSKFMQITRKIEDIHIFRQRGYDDLRENQYVQKVLQDDFKAQERLDQDHIYQFSTDVKNQDTPLKQKQKIAPIP